MAASRTRSTSSILTVQFSLGQYTAVNRDKINSNDFFFIQITYVFSVLRCFAISDIFIKNKYLHRVIVLRNMFTFHQKQFLCKLCLLSKAGNETSSEMWVISLTTFILALYYQVVSVTVCDNCLEYSSLFSDFFVMSSTYEDKALFI